MAVVWTAESADDFLSALTYLRQRNPAAANALSRRVDQALRMLDELPLDGPEIKLEDGAIVRSWPMSPFRAYYQRRGSDVFVVRLYDQHRKPIERP